MIRFISILTSIWFVAMGVPKLFGMTLWAVQFEDWGYPLWLLYTVGTIETVFGVLLLFRRTRVLAAGVLLIVMLGAGFTHAIHLEGWQVIKPMLSAAALLWLILKERQKPFRRKAASE